MDLHGFTRGKNCGKPDLWIQVLVEVSQAQIQVWPWSMVSTCVGTHGSVHILTVAKPFLCMPLACTLSKADLPIELIELLEKIIIQ